jgi:hypothetical protein
MKEKEISARQVALNKALQSKIIKKIDEIRENILFEKGSDKSSYFQMLMMIDEDLDDVLLNWEYTSINPSLSFPGSVSDLDELDDDDDY